MGLDRMTWTMVDSQLVRSFQFQDFASAHAFVNQVAHVAEVLDHHPSILLEWGHVEVRSWSHDTGGITDRDHDLIRAIDELIQEGADGTTGVCHSCVHLHPHPGPN